MAEIKHEFDEELEKRVEQHVVTDEYYLAVRNNQFSTNDFESYIDLFDSVRSEKNYDWKSDISIPEFASQMLTQAGIDANQAFSTKDTVETYLEDESEEALLAAEAQKELINRTLNLKNLYHYQKYMRAKQICNISGRVYLQAWWDQELRREIIGTETKVNELDVDVYGNEITDRDIQVPAKEFTEEDVEGDVVVTDQFNYDVIDERNVFTDNEYVYSIQQKKWIIIRTEKTLHELRVDAAERNYFNLDVLGKMTAPVETEASQESYNKYKKDEKKQSDAPASDAPFDVIKRYGKFWCIIEERDESGYPIKVKPGIESSSGKPVKDAEFLETIITFALTNSTQVMIGFQTTPFLDANDKPYRPITRGLCYIHPVEDGGTGDGRYARELQIGINDTFNVSADRTMLATIPTLTVKKFTNEDNPTVRIQPDHNIEVENQDDVQALQISDDVNGAIGMMGVLTEKMQQTTSIYPTTMGSLPSKASTTATAVAGAETRSNTRANYKNLTFDNTAMSELFWMISQMTFRFAKPETGVKLMGKKVANFNPWRDDYYYKPVAQSSETEHTKQVKINKWIQVLGHVAQIQHPDIVKQVNYILTQIFKYMGDEFVNFGDKLLDTGQQITQGGEQQPGQGQGEPTSNQNGLLQSSAEVGARQAASF